MSEPAPIDPASSSSPPEDLSFWQGVREALKGAHHDYTAAPLNRAVLLLAVPMVLEMIMESLFAVTDVFWVSRLGKEAIAVVGLTESVMSLIYAVAIGTSFAATAIIARRIGEKDPARASQAAGQIILIGVSCAAVIGALLGSFAPEILGLMGANADTVAIGTNFARTMLGGNMTVFMIFLINAIFRGAGDAVIAMRTLWLANALNMVLDPCFIFGLGPFPMLGVTGAAVATNLGRGLGVMYQLWHLTSGRHRVHLRWPHLRPNGADLLAILRPAWNGIAQLLINTTSWVGLYKIIAQSGSDALAGYTVAIRLVIFGLMPAWGLANAGATLVGQNLGALKPDRAEAAVRLALKYNVIFLGSLGAIFVVFSHFIVRAFTDDPVVLHYGTQALWIISLAFPLYAAGMCYEGAFNGSGDTSTPTRLNFFCFWLGQVPLAWFLARVVGLGALGVFIAVPISFSVLTLWSRLIFLRGNWKRKKV